MMKDKGRYFTYICIIIFAYALFLFGFFPLKVVLPGLAKRENFTFGPEGRVFGYPEKRHSRLVLVLIDALREDFVFERDSMQFTRTLIKKEKSRNYVLRAHPPTVTLPRIKAITTGSIPGFVDVVLNYDSQALTEDNIISQAHRLGKRIVFYGDDTWIKLFPGHFSRSDGTTSFFVTDYTEVDNNVTRHLARELKGLDWDLLVLHYLGLDHIGHTAGPSSPLVDPKLAEMDAVIQQVYTALEQKSPDSVVLVCGDHGMSDQGSHGGASDGEVLVPALFLSPSFSSQKETDGGWRSHRQPLQVDLAPTLSVLLGLAVPNNNLGQVLVGALGAYTWPQRLDTVYINARQLLVQLQQNTVDYTKEPSYQLYQRALQLHEDLLKSHSQETPAVFNVLHGYETAMDAMATKISSSLTKYDLYSMALGILLLLLMLLNEVLTLVTCSSKDVFVTVSPVIFCAISLVTVFSHMTACTSQSFHSTRLCGSSPVAVMTQAGVFLCLQFLAGNFLHTLNSSTRKKKWLPGRPVCLLLAVGTAGHSVSLLSSSFVEEEHQAWYCLTATFHLVAMATLVIQHITAHLQSEVTRQKHTVLGSKQIELRDKTGEDCLYEGQYVMRDHSQGDRQSGASKTDLTVSNAAINGYMRKTDTVNSGSFVNKSLFEVSLGRLLPWKPVVAMCGVLLLGRCLRSINQTGNKWLDVADVGDWLIRPENKSVLSVIVVLSLLVILSALASGPYIDTLLVAAGLAGCYGYRVATKAIYSIWYLGIDEPDSKMSKGTFEAMLVYCVIFTINFLSFLRYMRNNYRQQDSLPKDQMQQQVKLNIITNVQSSFVILMTLLFRPHNTVLVAMVILQERLLWKHLVRSGILSLPVWSMALFCWWMGQTVFFQQGNSNSLATVDVAAGYVGLTDYTPAVVLLLLYCSTYAGPLFWLLTLLKYILTVHSSHGNNSHSVHSAGIWSIKALTLERLFTLSLYCIVVTTQRYHLFVWTVFSPKLLYEAWLTATYALFSFIIMLVTK